jgi:hypothetical protein
MQYLEGRDDRGEPLPDESADVPPRDPPLGSREHIQQTLKRARAAIEASKARRSQSQALIARADTTERLWYESNALCAQLHVSVTAYVRSLRDDGTPPERMVVLVKTAVQEVAAAELDAIDGRSLMEDVVRWSIDAYYDAA